MARALLAPTLSPFGIFPLFHEDSGMFPLSFSGRSPRTPMLWSLGVLMVLILHNHFFFFCECFTPFSPGRNCALTLPFTPTLRPQLLPGPFPPPTSPPRSQDSDWTDQSFHPWKALKLFPLSRPFSLPEADKKPLSWLT